MPAIRITGSLEINKTEKENILKDISDIVSNITGKTKKYITAIFQTPDAMISAESNDKSVFVEIKSIGALSPENTFSLSEKICTYFYEKYSVEKDRINIEFRDVERPMWGWNGKTFA